MINELEEDVDGRLEFSLKGFFSDYEIVEESFEF